MAEPKFAFYEKVRVQTANPNIADLNGMLAAVLGRAQNDDETWGYAIHVYERSTTYSVAESELVTTSEHAKRGDFYAGAPTPVSKDGEQLGQTRRTTRDEP